MRETLHLPDGRRLDRLELGDGAGVPALYFHGTPSSAAEGRWLDRAARAHGVRLVAFDRGGYLDSEAHGKSSLLGGARDALAAAEALGLGRFATVGFSGGAGFALAAAHLAPGRVTVVHLAGGMAPGGTSDLSPGRRLAFAAAAGTPSLVRPLLGAALRLNLRGLDGRLADPRVAARWFFEGPAKGAQVAAVAAPVEVWHGLADPAVPAVYAKRVAAALPAATLHLYDGKGHFVLHTHADEVAASIREHAG
jgi:pimeloyl-ACP methyl ester carboxylesterase